MSEQIQNFATLNPFDEKIIDDSNSSSNVANGKSSVPSKIHIRIQQRNGRKTLTTVQGLPKELDPKKVLKVFKKEFACNGTIVEDEDLGEVIQLQGDHRVNVSQILIEEGICTKDNVQIHGF